MYKLPDVIVEKGDVNYLAGQELRHHTFKNYPLPASNLPLIARRETLKAGNDFGHHQLDDFYSLWVMRGGRGVHVINGHPYGVRRGDVYIMPAGGIHGYRDYENIECDAFYFQAHLFSKTELAALQELAGFWDLFVSATPRRNTPFHDRRLHLMPEQYHEVEAIVAAIRAEICAPLAIGPIMARYRFYCLLGALARWHSSAKTKKRFAMPARKTRDRSNIHDQTTASQDIFHVATLAEVVAYCDEHFSQNLTVPQLAARMCLSTSHFAKLFTSQVGMPPARYLRSLQLERAQALLRESDSTVTQIARQTGFADVEHLIHSFRNAFDVSPSKYRAQFRR